MFNIFLMQKHESNVLMFLVRFYTKSSLEHKYLFIYVSFYKEIRGCG